MGTKWPNLKTGGPSTLRGKSDRLYNAVKGGADWFDDIKPLSFSFGIDGIPYADAHQKGLGNMPQRAFLFKPSGELDDDSENFLVRATDSYLDEKNLR
jgi:hypothetical protein